MVGSLSLKGLKHFEPPYSVDRFLAKFRLCDGVYAIDEMCWIIAGESLAEMQRPFAIADQEYLCSLLATHIKNHIDGIGGEDQLCFYTLEELNELGEAEASKLREMLKGRPAPVR